MPRPIAHGTPTGHDDGCRGANCANHKTPLMTCTEAWTRYRGDWEYMRAVDAGTATTEKASYAKPKVARLVAETKEAAAKRPETKPRRPRGAPQLRTPKPMKHGTRYGADKGGCKSDCPNEAAGGISCIQARRNASNANKQKNGGYTPRKKPVHGTAGGYYAFPCRKDCPAEMSCTKAASAESFARKQKAKAA